jgi:integrase
MVQNGVHWKNAAQHCQRATSYFRLRRIASFEIKHLTNVDTPKPTPMSISGTIVLSEDELTPAERAERAAWDEHLRALMARRRGQAAGRTVDLLDELAQQAAVMMRTPPADIEEQDEVSTEPDFQIQQADDWEPERQEPKTTIRSKLHRGHFAFMRSYVEGLDLRKSWDRYLSLHGAVTDPRAVRSAVSKLREDLAAAAKRHARPGLARLLRLDINAIKEIPLAPPPALPSLEEFAFERGLDEFSQAEQLEAYEAEFGKPTAQQSRRSQLLGKQLAALRWLEDVAAELPVPDDAVSAWLIPSLATPLEKAGTKTLRELVDRINGMGKGWSTGLRAIGASKAARIVAWLRSLDHDPAFALGAHAETPRRRVAPQILAAVTAPGVGVLPIEKFLVPASLDGSKGLYRGPRAQCMLRADTDREALFAFIRSKPGLAQTVIDQRRSSDIAAGRLAADDNGSLVWLRYLTSTQRAYLDEIHRFILWAILQRDKAASSIDFEDAAAYREFLLAPQPMERWCSQARGRERYGPLWRPFAGPLKPSAAALALTRLQAFYGFLHAKGYVMANAFSDLAAPRAIPTTDDTARSLTAAEWAHVMRRLEDLPPTSANIRLKFGLRLMYATGLRRSEAVAARVSDLRWVCYPPDIEDPEMVEGWELWVVGKGSVLRKIPVPDLLIEDLADYLQSRGLDGDVKAPGNKHAFLLGQASDIAQRAPNSPAARKPFDPCAGIGGQTWYDQLVAFFSACAQQLAAEDPDSAAHLEQATTHWLRHTKITHSLAAGTAPHIERVVAGHASIDTTSGYDNPEGKRRMRGSAAFFATAGVRGPAH